MELAAPGEYGFFANVNPHVDHPRWSQATERFIGSGGALDVKRQRCCLTGMRMKWRPFTVASIYGRTSECV